jgi:uncharacterized protein involved in exopolysaccharide biosynthesis
VIGSIVGLRALNRFSGRAAVFGTLIAIALIFSFYPERYRAAVSLTPTDPGSLGLSGTLGQLGAINSVFGNQTAVEVALRVARSEMVRDIVIQQLNLENRLHEHDRTKLHRWLADKVDIRSLRGGIVLMDMQSRDPALAKDIVGAFAGATQDRLAQISRAQTGYKRDILLKLVSDASEQLSEAQARYDSFRLRNRAPTPTMAVESVSERIPQLEGEIKKQQVDLAAARQLYTDDNNVVRQMRAQLSALQSQLAEVRATNPTDDSSVGKAVSTSSQLFKLERDLNIARALYDSYLRYLQGTAVEDLTSTANIRILEPPYVDTERQIFMPAAAIAIALFLIWGAVEFYRLRPPPGYSPRLEPAE